MDEESPAQRRERLLALRSAAGAAADSSASALPSLSPAAAAAMLPPPSQFPFPSQRFAPVDQQSQTMRFDYYTNPSAAFTDSHKRKSPSTPHDLGGRLGFSPRAPPFHRNNTPGSSSHSSSELSSSVQHRAPNPVYPNSPQVSFHNQLQFQTSGYPGAPTSCSPIPGQGLRPHQLQTPLSWQPRTHLHGPLPSQPMYQNLPRFGNVTTDSSRWRPRHSSPSDSGRGRGQGQINVSGGRGSGSARGRGRGMGDASYNPWQYYSVAMVQDPWQGLQPIVGNILVPRDGSKSLLRRLLIVQKTETATEGQPKSSGLSLAEYLDQCMNETAEE